jgi:hypothetical protein
VLTILNLLFFFSKPNSFLIIFPILPVFQKKIKKMNAASCVTNSKYLQMWPSLIAKAKEGGLDAIETYVFWNVHEPQPGHVCIAMIPTP